MMDWTGAFVSLRGPKEQQKPAILPVDPGQQLKKKKLINSHNNSKQMIGIGGKWLSRAEARRAAENGPVRSITRLALVCWATLVYLSSHCALHQFTGEQQRVSSLFWGRFQRNSLQIWPFPASFALYYIRGHSWPCRSQSLLLLHLRSLNQSSFGSVFICIY